MAATTQELIMKSFQIHNGNTAIVLKQKVEMIASHYGSTSAFLKATRKDFDKIVFKIDDKKFKLSDNEFQKIQALQKSGLIDAKLSVEDNFIKILTTQFVQRQLEMIDKLELETLNVNPILAGALNLNNETDLIRYYAYQAISRSMVTSVGFLVQNLLLYASNSVFDGKYNELGIATKWDLVVEKGKQPKAFLEIKSGTNDLNKSQIHHFEKEIKQIEKQGFKAFIGETYGKREDKTVTHGLYKMYLPNWEKRTLIGKELWEFISGKKNYHEKLIETLFKTSKELLADETFIKKIEAKIKPLTADFKKQYKSYKNFLKSLW
ncbi:MAG: hypothetical protein KF900_03595 [Bacteroidetes bacterium]|nr:hypothetical protein [Bacteroidota bacterium]